MIVSGIDIIIPIKPIKFPNKNTEKICNKGDILLVFLYILGDIIYSSIFGKTINTITVKINSFLDIDVAKKRATTLAIIPPK